MLLAAGFRRKAQTAMEEEAEVFEPLEIHYSDLVLLSSSRVSCSSLSFEELEKIETISGAVMRALGPSGSGLLSITGVPWAAALRRALLPMARELALLDKKERAQVLKENGLGSDVPLKNLDRSVSSFAMQLKYEQVSSLLSASTILNTIEKEEDSEDILKWRNFDFRELHTRSLHQLGSIFKELGRRMIELGLRLAKVCDKMIGGGELEQSILDAGTAKGRLIHYHSVVDNLILKEENKKSKGSLSMAIPTTPSPSGWHFSTSLDNKLLTNDMKNNHAEEVFCSKNRSEVGCVRNFVPNMWQHWHYDYGIFTVMTTPLFMSACCAKDSFFVKDCLPPDEHTYLQLFLSSCKKFLLVKASPESFIIQAGESADILSNGMLRSTLHSVGRPLEAESLSRETFVVFLQPPWGKVLPCPSFLMDDKAEDAKTSAHSVSSSCYGLEDPPHVGHMVGAGKSQSLAEEILKSVPPLSSRLRGAMTFAEFSRETTKQYYGGSGTQTRRQ